MVVRSIALAFAIAGAAFADGGWEPRAEPDATGATDGYVWTADGSNGAGWEAAAGGGGELGTISWIYAADLYSPNNADWAVNSLAPTATDSNDNSLKVRLFDASTAECAGLYATVPSGAADLTLHTNARAETTPGGAVVAKTSIYVRGIPDASATDAWTSEIQTHDIDLTTNENWARDSSSAQTLATLAVSAGENIQIEFCRDAAHASDTLASDLALLAIGVEWN